MGATQRARIGLVVPSFTDSGGVTSVAKFLLAVAENEGRYDIDLISLAVAADDSASTRLRSPCSWRRGVKCRIEDWQGRRFVHVGAPWSDFEFQRYARRRPLSELVERCDMIQVVCGSPAWAAPVVGLGKPVSLQVATLVRVERRRRDAAPRSLLALWRRAMTRNTARVEQRALQAVDAVQVENLWMLEHVSEVNAQRPNVDIRLAPPGVDAEAFEPLAARSPQEDPYVLCVGRLADPRKNVDMLLEAFEQVATKHRDVSLVTVGSSPPPETFWRSVRARGLAERVRHISSPSTGDLIGLYQRAAVFALSSDEEGLGIVLLEAMACGIPVVATRCGGPDGFISDSNDGYLVGVDDAQAMAEAIGRLLADPILNRQMGEAARATIERRFSREVTAQAFVDVWDKLMARTQGA